MPTTDAVLIAGRCYSGVMTDPSDTPNTSNPTAEAMKRALAARKAASTGAGSSGGFKPAQHEERRVAHQNTAANKPAFRKASKRG